MYLETTADCVWRIAAGRDVLFDFTMFLSFRYIGRVYRRPVLRGVVVQPLGRPVCGGKIAGSDPSRGVSV